MTQLKSVVKPVWVMQNIDVDNTANADSARVALNNYRRALFCVFLEASANDAFLEEEVITLTLDEATAVTGGVTAHLKEDIDIIGGVNATEVLIDVTNVADGSITINGVEFEFGTYHAATAPLEFADGDELETAINGQDMGLTVTRAGEVLTLAVTEQDSQTITVVEDVTHADTYASTMKACAIVEARAELLSSENDMRYVYLNVDNAATNNVDVSVVALLSSPYSAPVNQVVAVEG